MVWILQPARGRRRPGTGPAGFRYAAAATGWARTSPVRACLEPRWWRRQPSAPLPGPPTARRRRGATPPVWRPNARPPTGAGPLRGAPLFGAKRQSAPGAALVPVPPPIAPPPISAPWPEQPRLARLLGPRWEPAAHCALGWSRSRGLEPAEGRGESAWVGPRRRLEPESAQVARWVSARSWASASPLEVAPRWAWAGRPESRWVWVPRWPLESGLGPERTWERGRFERAGRNR